MPVAPTYPGVYIEEIKSQVHTITGVATSITAFVGYTARGIDARATRIFSFADYQRSFGGLASDSELSYAVQQFFTNGGTDAYVVRVPRDGSAAAAISMRDSAGGGAKTALTLTALSNGTGANSAIADIDYDGVPAADPKAFNLTITELKSGATETFSNVTLDSGKSNYVIPVVNDPDSGSKMVSAAVPDAAAGRPVASGTTGGDMTVDPATGLLNLGIDTTKTYKISMSSDSPAGRIANVPISFFEPGDAVPISAAGVCRLLERKANRALQQMPTPLPGATIRCVPSSSGNGIRVSGTNSLDTIAPPALDPTITFTAFAAAGPTLDADALLKLSTGTANVAHYWLGKGRATAAQSGAAAGSDGTGLPTGIELIGDEAKFTGIYALDKVDLFNILCLPDVTRAKPINSVTADLDLATQNAVFGAAMTYCLKRRAFLLVDPPPSVAEVSAAVDWKSKSLTVHNVSGAAYFPRLRLPDPLNNLQPRVFAPCGVVAGMYARIDAARGVWKAPAGLEAGLTGAQGLVYKLNDEENGVLNILGLNCFRVFPIYGNVCWGARTLVGADAEGSEWKYVPVRRMALFLEESLYRGTQWVVFEPNDEPLWSQIRLNLTAFMLSLFRQGAFQGTKPSDAFFVKCDKDTTTQDDINKGIVNILVGFAPLKPAEFVIIQISQLAGQVV